MTKVFFGGSKKLSRLNRAVRERADNIVAKGFEVLIGDANGADKAMQEYLAEKSYQNVIVFCMNGTCRNNIGSWHTKVVSSKSEKKDFSYFAAKDKEMSERKVCVFLWALSRKEKSRNKEKKRIQVLKLDVGWLLKEPANAKNTLIRTNTNNPSSSPRPHPAGGK